MPVGVAHERGHPSKRVKVMVDPIRSNLQLALLLEGSWPQVGVLSRGCRTLNHYWKSYLLTYSFTTLLRDETAQRSLDGRWTQLQRPAPGPAVAGLLPQAFGGGGGGGGHPGAADLLTLTGMGFTRVPLGVLMNRWVPQREVTRTPIGSVLFCSWPCCMGCRTLDPDFGEVSLQSTGDCS